MISGILGYKWAVKGSTWIDAFLFGLVAWIVNIGLSFLIKSILRLDIMNLILNYGIFGVSVFLTALYYKKKPNKVARDITLKSIIVSIIISILLLAVLGFLVLSFLGSSTVI